MRSFFLSSARPTSKPLSPHPQSPLHTQSPPNTDPLLSTSPTNPDALLPSSSASSTLHLLPTSSPSSSPLTAPKPILKRRPILRSKSAQRLRPLYALSSSSPAFTPPPSTGALSSSSPAGTPSPSTAVASPGRSSPSSSSSLSTLPKGATPGAPPLSPLGGVVSQGKHLVYPKDMEGRHLGEKEGRYSGDKESRHLGEKEGRHNEDEEAIALPHPPPLSCTGVPRGVWPFPFPSSPSALPSPIPTQNTCDAGASAGGGASAGAGAGAGTAVGAGAGVSAPQVPQRRRRQGHTRAASGGAGVGSKATRCNTEQGTNTTGAQGAHQGWTGRQWEWGAGYLESRGTVAELEKLLKEQNSVAESRALPLEEPDVIRYRVMQHEQERQGREERPKIARWASLPRQWAAEKVGRPAEKIERRAEILDRSGEKIERSATDSGAYSSSGLFGKGSASCKGSESKGKTPDYFPDLLTEASGHVTASLAAGTDQVSSTASSGSSTRGLRPGNLKSPACGIPGASQEAGHTSGTPGASQGGGYTAGAPGGSRDGGRTSSTPGASQEDGSASGAPAASRDGGYASGSAGANGGRGSTSGTRGANGGGRCTSGIPGANGGIGSTSGSPGANWECGGGGQDMELLVRGLGRERSIKERRETAMTVRAVLKASKHKKQVFIAAGGIPALIDLLECGDPAAVEHGVTALLNLTPVEGVSAHIVAAGGMKAVVQVLRSGTATARGNAAAALFVVCTPEDNKTLARTAGAIPPLVELLERGNMRSQKDAALALFTLSRNLRCTHEIVKAGAVRALLGILQRGGGMEDKCMAVLANLSKLPAGRAAILLEPSGLSLMLDMVQLGDNNYNMVDSPTVIPHLGDMTASSLTRIKEDAVVVLLQLACNGEAELEGIRMRGIARELQKMSKSGSPRMEKYAMPLLEMINSRSNASSVRPKSQGSSIKGLSMLSPVTTPLSGSSPLLSPLGLFRGSSPSISGIAATAGFSFRS